MPFTDKQLDQWARMRQLGRSRYVWRVGVVYWGILTGTIWSVVMAALQGWEQFPIMLPLALLLFPLGGYFFGHWTWKMNESAYLKQRPD